MSDPAPEHEKPAHDKPAHDKPAHDKPAHDKPARDEPARGKPFELWSSTQRAVLIAFVLILASVLLIRLAYNRMYVSKPPPARAARYDELADRLDPNIATWQELAVLPQIGEKRAKEIVAYRETSVTAQPNRLPFVQPHDLMNVKGIGPAVVETLRPHLMFPATTQPTGGISADSQNRPPPGP